MKGKNITKEVSTHKEIASIYYKLIGALYNIHLTDMELGVMMYTSIYGTISTPPAREEFIKEYNSSKASLHNIISRLQKRKLLIKDEFNKIRIRPELCLLTDDSYQFKIILSIKKEEDEKK